MTIAEIHRLLVDTFGSEIILDLHTDSLDPWIEVAPSAIPEVGRFLRDEEQTQFTHLTDLCGVDYFEPDESKRKKFPFEPHIEVIYQLTSDAHRSRCTLKVKLPRWEGDEVGQLPDLPTVSGVWAIADWHERECYDLIGVNFIGHPNPRRILCPEDWVGHPLRKDYQMPLEYHGIRGQ